MAACEHMDRGRAETQGPVAGAGIFQNLEKLPTIKEVCEALVAEAMSRSRNNQRPCGRHAGNYPIGSKQEAEKVVVTSWK